MDTRAIVSSNTMDPHVARNMRPPEIETIVELLQTAFPENEKIKQGVLPLLSTKKAYIKILLDKWYSRNVPIFSAMEVQESCNDFFKNHSDNEAIFQITYGNTITVNANKKYVYTYNCTEKGVPGSYGLNPFIGKYEQIQYEGEMDFEKLFDFLIDYDKSSKSINLFESLKKIIDRGNLIGFSDKQWQSVILRFAKKY